FKDRYVMDRYTHGLLEGIMISSYAIGAHKAFIYIRGEYVRQTENLLEQIQAAYEKGSLGKGIFGSDFDLDVVVHRGAGAYICGEETALLESLEGKKGWPRMKPPFPAVEGVFRCPTIVNNVETIAYVPSIIEKGGAWFARLGTERNGGLRFFSVSGHVEKPGVYELPMGTPLREIIYDHAGGIKGGKTLKAVVPGGSSSPVLTADEIDVKMDYDSLAEIGSMLGSAGVIVMDETTDIVRALYVVTRFYWHESCGQCTPCREGTGWAEKILKRILSGNGRPNDVDNLVTIADNIIGNTICPLGDAAALPIQSYVKKFRDEFDAYVANGKASVGEQEELQEVAS
nr:NADH-quinone oxidoreductase subunit NuoF [candidate division KSB1 bacterium]NIR72868.1 NADH-quinone oxidoreductase subunit NuoF [candidate division KSB1 bacterium]NIS25145.1 NADH-quinone oxidoreductase subunit NuoF [candidate division KSB1 bacterium]NIT72056.1 NADH-quinone oxidoreductase subunit NuoF [candidate division KSB1 bacterium]NIU25847.1 NADH-quinone oxidoreductase subunit NuoF [candidate division KSB1 bacterium]